MSAYAKKDVPKKIQGTQFECEDIDEEEEGVKGPEADPAMKVPKKTVGKSMAHLEKADDDMDDDEDEDGDDDMSKTKKSAVTEASLRKSLRRLQGFVEDTDATTRKSSLLQRALDGYELRKSEREELAELLADRHNARASASESITKSMRDNEAVQKAIDVSEYLTAQHVELVKALGALAEQVEGLQKSQQDFNLMLAKAHVDTGSVVKSMAERINTFAEAPAAAPKSMGVTPGTRAIQKSFGAPAAGAADGDLNKSDVISALTKMNRESWEMGKSGKSDSGENLTKAVARYESTRELSDALRAEVVARLRH